MRRLLSVQIDSARWSGGTALRQAGSRSGMLGKGYLVTQAYAEGRRARGSSRGKSGHRSILTRRLRDLYGSGRLDNIS